MEKLTFIEQVASGAFGEVYRATERTTGAEVAVKRMKEVLEEGSEEYEMAIREVVLLKRLSHVNIIRLQKAFKTPRGRLYLVFDYVPLTLQGMLKQQVKGTGLPMKQVKSLAFQLVMGLHYLHEQSIIHRDIKPSNLLVTLDGVLKICDFGFARFLERQSLSHQGDYSTYVVTRWYRPPEICVGDAYGSAVDIWAVGCILVELLTGQALFPGRNNNDQLFLIMQGLGNLSDKHLKIILGDPSFISFRMPTKQESYTLEQRFQKYQFDSDTWALLHGCLDPNPSKRLTAQSLLQMKFFDGILDLLPAEAQATVPRTRTIPFKSISFSKQPKESPAAEVSHSCSEPQVSFSRPLSSSLTPSVDDGKKQKAIASAKALVQAAANKALLEGDDLIRRLKFDRPSMPSTISLPAPNPSYAKAVPHESKHRRNDSSSSVEGGDDKLADRTSFSSCNSSQKPPMPQSNSLNNSLDRRSPSPSGYQHRGPMRFSGGIGSLVDVISTSRISLNGSQYPPKQDSSVLLKFKPSEQPQSMDGGYDESIPLGRVYCSSGGGAQSNGYLPELPRSISCREAVEGVNRRMPSGVGLLPALTVKGTNPRKANPKPFSEPFQKMSLEQPFES